MAAHSWLGMADQTQHGLDTTAATSGQSKAILMTRLADNNINQQRSILSSMRSIGLYECLVLLYCRSLERWDNRANELQLINASRQGECDLGSVKPSATLPRMISAHHPADQPRAYRAGVPGSSDPDPRTRGGPP